MNAPYEYIYIYIQHVYNTLIKEGNPCPIARSDSTIYMAYYTVGHLLHGEEGPKGPKTWRPSVGGFFKAAVRSAAGELGWQKGQPGRDQGDLAALENIGDVRT
jgi:hypothetical protein